jgi:hypothetical protein
MVSLMDLRLAWCQVLYTNFWTGLQGQTLIYGQNGLCQNPRHYCSHLILASPFNLTFLHGDLEEEVCTQE